ncbi:lipid II:glycine glycyltransferase FemX [Maribacter sp. 2307UL18-2]|uniref:lipid II:glycine glycyltransferase FemX n=1 Tax=Maribacter sp. 2307UL18-2 TaxID=3386274 RepID=UPI0039BCEDD8
MIKERIQIETDYNTVSDSEWIRMLQARTSNYFQTPGAIQFFKAANIETFTYTLRKMDRLVALLSGIIQKEKGIKSNFTSRAIIYGGPIFSEEIEENDAVEMFLQLIAALKNKVIYIEFRNLNDYRPYHHIFKKTGFTYHSHLNFHLNCTDEILMRKRMSKSKLRQVKKSIAAGAEIMEAQNIEQIASYYAILQNLYRTKVKTPLPGFDFFEKLWLRKAAKFLLIQYQGEVVGGIVAPILDRKVIYEWFVCGKDGAFKNVYPSILATWAAMDYANKNNIPRFDFMGAGKPDESYGVREFKSKFGGELVEYGRYTYVAKPILFEIGKKAVQILKKST